MMKKLITLIICLWIFQSANSQTYLQGYNVVQISGAVTCPLLSPAERLTIDQAYAKLKEIDTDPIEKSANEMNGEFWLMDGMLVNLVTRTVTEQNPRVNLYERQKAYAPEIIYREGTTPDRTAANDYFSEIKSVNNFEVLVDYFKTRSNYKSFLIQDNKGKFKIMGTIYVKKQDAPKAHALINTILNNLQFKE